MEENRKRIDALMVSLGVAPSREKAKEMIKSGNVYLNGKVVSKAGLLASDCDIIEYKGESERYVSRGGLKLEKAAPRIEIYNTVNSCKQDSQHYIFLFSSLLAQKKVEVLTTSTLCS